ncbi:MAG: sigma 54-interacting transcriptional regulator [Clostridia bacterium]|nr:sigma 54-interacting transcriptional regulator [Clostridia bacterium]
MKRELNKIRPMLESVIKAISSVVKVDITITDGALNRIASTGQYIQLLDDKIEQESIFGYVLQHKAPMFVDNPRENKVCNLCKHRMTCKEFAEVCCPIILEDEIIGIIGLVAFDKEQERAVIDNREHLIEFLESMAGLIASKISEERQREQVALQSREADVLIDYIDRGVISVNPKGEIIRYNQLSDEYFDIKHKKIDSIHKIICCKEECNIFDPSAISYNHYFSYEMGDVVKEFVYTGKPIFYNNQVVEVVLSFRKTEKMIDEVYEILGQPIKTTFDDILGESELLGQVIERGRKAAKSCSSVLIQGESGTGKELFARAIHYESNRRDQALVAINCAAIPENLLESELFGYEEGAFSGAKLGGKLGKFELADKGTLFLDEIGDMPIHLQAKLLRVLQERVVERVGGKYGIPIDVRVIAATNKPLESLVKEGQFREDLFYRLNVIPLNIPSLKQRKVDIPLLVTHFVRRFNQKLNKNISGCDEAVLSMFRNYGWKGNIRELENIIEYSVNMCSEQWIGMDDLPMSMRRDEEEVAEETIMNFRDLERLELQKAIGLYGKDKDGIEKTLMATGLSRATYYRKIKEYHL